MGTLDLLTEHLKDQVQRRNSRVLVLATAPEVELAQAQAGELAEYGLRLEALGSDAAVPVDLVRDVDLLVIEVDPGNAASMRRIGQVRERWPHLPIVAAISDSSVSLVRTLVRQGVSDVVALPLDFNEVLQVSLDTLAQQEGKATAEARLAPMVAVVRSIGGCGATSVATHLAADLAAHAKDGRGAVIVDLDLQFGAVGHFLGVTPRGDLSTLLEANDRLDEELLRSVVADAGHGLAVVAAPSAILPLETVDTDGLLRVLQMLRRHYGYVVLDLPANWTNWTLSAVAAADALVMVVELTIASLRQAQRRLELFRSVGIESAAIQIVVNRVEKRLFRTIDLDDVARTLNHPVLGSIALEAPLVNAAQDQGHLVGDVQRKSRFTSDIATIGELLRNGRLARGH